MKIDISFEPVRDAHVPLLADIFNHYVEHSAAIFITKPISNDKMRAMLFFEDARYAAFAIFTDNALAGNEFTDNALAGNEFANNALAGNEITDKTLAGFVSIHGHNPRDAYRDTADITLYLAPGYTGRGIGTRAVAFIEEYAKSRRFHALLAGISGVNIASIRLFDKMGYIKVAHFKELGYKHGQFLDVLWYEKII